MHYLVFDAIGTKWQIEIDTSLPTKKRILLEKLIRKRIDEFDKTYSRFRTDSFIRKIAVKKGKYQLPADAGPIFILYDQLYKLTGGYFTPLIGQVLVDAGYDEAYSLKPKQLHRPLSWDKAFNYNPPYLTIKKPSLLDFGAAGKGYLIDIVSEILEENGVNSYCVEAGGDIRNRRNKKRPLRVGLENPDNFQQVIGVANLANESICGSAGNRRKWGNYHHIIDPYTLTSPGTSLHPASPPFVKATWVIASTTMPGASRYPTMLADGLATCLFFVSAETLLNKYSFEYIIMYSGYSIKKSAGFNGELYLKNYPHKGD